MAHALYIGNFDRPWKTESEIARTLRAMGHTVAELDEMRAFEAGWQFGEEPADFVLWTHSRSQHYDAQRRMMRWLRVPLVGIHLDRFWDLKREHLIADAPFFKCDVVHTADGGNNDRFAAAGVEHRWFQPAICDDQAVRGTHHNLNVDVAFVGSWRRYHEEWPHRLKLIRWLAERHAAKFKPYPDGRQPLHGTDLADVYASVPVIVGDSCFADVTWDYWSDRVPTSVGRGGFLIHPRVYGLEEHYTDAEHLVLWSAGDWEELAFVIDRALAEPQWRETIASAGYEHVKENHLMSHRLTEILAAL